jgi:hypothetical protein
MRRAVLVLWMVPIELEAGTVELHASLVGSRSRSIGALLSVAGLTGFIVLVVLWRSDRDLVPASRGAA